MYIKLITGKRLTITSFIERIYLLIPACCFGVWALVYLMQDRLIFNDFIAFYNAGKLILVNPQKLYSIQGYFYLPSFALAFSVSISLFPFMIAYIIFFIS